MKTVTRKAQARPYRPIFCASCGGVIQPRREAERPVSTPDGRYHARCYVPPAIGRSGGRASDLYAED